MKSDHCNYNILPCNPKIAVHFSHLVMPGQFLLKLCLIGLVMCCISPSHNISVLLLCAQFSSLALWLILVTCRSVSFFGHMQHMSSLVLDIADTVDFLLFYYLIGTGIILHTLELICLHIFWYNPISWLYGSIIFLPNML